MKLKFLISHEAQVKQKGRRLLLFMQVEPAFYFIAFELLASLISLMIELLMHIISRIGKKRLQV